MAVEAIPLAAEEVARKPAPHTAARHCLCSAIFWLIISSLIGLMASFQFFNPQWSAGIEWISYGRLRAAYTNTAMLFFLSLGFIGAAFYIVPHVCGSSLWSERLGIFTAWLWNLISVLTIVAVIAAVNLFVRVLRFFGGDVENGGRPNVMTRLTAPAGIIRIEAKNTGQATHNIHIFDRQGGNSIKVTDPLAVSAGGTGTLEVTLQPGIYFYQCDFHPKEMTGTLVMQ